MDTVRKGPNIGMNPAANLVREGMNTLGRAVTRPMGSLTSNIKAVTEAVGKLDLDVMARDLYACEALSTFSFADVTDSELRAIAEKCFRVADIMMEQRRRV
jgi:hypothetical protein